MTKKSILTMCCIPLCCLIIPSCYMHANVKQIDNTKMQKTYRILSVSPAKAQLVDGSLIIFRDGCTVENDTLKGEGIKYNLIRENPSSYTSQLTKVPIDSVVYLKRYIMKVEWFSSVIQNPLAVFFLIFYIGGIVLGGL